MLTGIQVYNEVSNNYILGYISFGLFYGFWLFLEISYLLKTRYIDEAALNIKIMGCSDINSRLLKGERLIILDDMVLDVSRFSHPGGMKFIDISIGRDVSRFFYGSQSLLGRLNEVIHPDYAKIVARRMAIGRIRGGYYLKEGALAVHSTILIRDEVVRRMVYNVVFQTDSVVRGIQKYYSDLSMIGKHYLVYHIDDSSKKRMYTICNCM